MTWISDYVLAPLADDAALWIAATVLAVALIGLVAASRRRRRAARRSTAPPQASDGPTTADASSADLTSHVPAYPQDSDDSPATGTSSAGVTPRVARGLVMIAVTAAMTVAILAGIRSFGAVSHRFGSPIIPLIADGMIIACTALRLAALARGWRLPGSLAVTWLFIGGTVYLNMTAATSTVDAVAHALAPISYAVLIEMLAHLLRLHLRLAAPTRAQLTALLWATSPIITTRVWLHLSRTGGTDVAAARALVQQITRASSRLRAVCPSPHARPFRVSLWPWDEARAARRAAVHTVRDGLLSAAELAYLLPVGAVTLSPAALLALIDQAALRIEPTAERAPAQGPTDRSTVPEMAERPPAEPELLVEPELPELVERGPVERPSAGPVETTSARPVQTESARPVGLVEPEPTRPVQTESARPVGLVEPEPTRPIETGPVGLVGLVETGSVGLVEPEPTRPVETGPVERPTAAIEWEPTHRVERPNLSTPDPAPLDQSATASFPVGSHEADSDDPGSDHEPRDQQAGRVPGLAGERVRQRDEDLLQRALVIAERLGRVPSRDVLRVELRVGSTRAGRIQDLVQQRHRQMAEV